MALKPDAPAGPVAEIISLRTNDPTAPVVQVNVTGTVQAPVTLTPDAVRFGKVKVGQSATVQVIVRGTNGTPFVVQPVAEDADGVSAETFPARRSDPDRDGQVPAEPAGCRPQRT